MPKRARSFSTGPVTRDFCARLTAARETRGWSKYELADAASLTRQRVIHLEQGIEHPRLFEVEQLAMALEVDIAALLGLESRRDDEQDERSAAILEDLSAHLLAAVDLVIELLKNREAPERSAKTPEPHVTRKVEDQERAAWQWEKILPEAERLLREQPERSWRPAELVRAIRESGLELESYRGLHFAITPQLRSANLINEDASGNFTAKAVKGPDSKDERSCPAPRSTAAVSSPQSPSESELSVQQPEGDLEYDPHDSALHSFAQDAAAKKQGVPKSVLKASRGKRLLIAGGQGSHEALRLSVRKALQFKAVDWITGERNPNPVELFALAVRNKRYDIVLLMSGTAPSDLQPMIAACKEVGASFYFLPVTPSIPSVAEAIFAERVVGAGLSEWMETSQSAIPTRKTSVKTE